MTKFLQISLLFSALAASPALAQSASRIESRIVVSAADLDLKSTADQRTLDRRLARAVIEACGDASTVDLAGSNDIRRCRTGTSASIAGHRDRLVQMATKRPGIALAAR